MKLVYKGKTKDFYDLENGTFMLKFKDDATGKDGVFDPGENQVGLTIDGLGMASLRLTDYFFRKISAAGIPTHFISANIEQAEMVVMQAKNFGEVGKGLEVICRFRATGGFMRRYGAYAKEGQPLDALVEVTLKDDERGDPLINQDALVALGLMTSKEYETIVSYTRKIAVIIKDDLAGKGLELYDMKVEFGRLDESGEIALMDEISAGCLRVYKNGTIVSPLELDKLILG